MVEQSEIQKIAEEVSLKQGILDKKIGEDAYSLKLLPATTGASVGLRLINLALPIVGVVVDKIGEQEFVLPEDKNMWTEASILLVRQMDQVDVVDTIKLLLNQSSCNGVAIDFDQHFAANYGKLMSLVEFALEVNFKDFFTEYLKGKGLDLSSLRAKITQGQTQQE